METAMPTEAAVFEQSVEKKPEQNEDLKEQKIDSEKKEEATDKEQKPPSCQNVASPMRQRRQLEPSLQAWAASQARGPLLPRNVGRSEAAANTSRRDRGAHKAGGGQSSRPTSAQRSQSKGSGTAEISCTRSSSGYLGHSEDELRVCEWDTSLRKGGAAQPDFWGKSYQPTVPQAPRLRTSERSRSRSCSSSREGTPQGTPVGTPQRAHSRSVTPQRGACSMPPKEKEAVEQYLSRMALSRLESPARNKIAFGRHVDDRVAPSPARSARSQASDASTESRLSQLSRPRSLSKDLRSTEDIQCLRAEEAQRALREQRKRNERSCKKALLATGKDDGRKDRSLLTHPKGPELMTPRRAERARSTSWHRVDGCQSLLEKLKQHPIPREQAAIQRHIERSVAGALGFSLGSAAGPGDLQPAAKREAAAIPDGVVDLDRWVQESANAEERAQRARQAVLARRDSAWASERQRLCVFKPSGSTAVASNAEEDQQQCAVASEDQQQCAEEEKVALQEAA
eukprot:TRINITY_DN10416_c0_g2_i1.p1 TRINITY_DN10416_c0_g2~~TRINITY_DN10416_c0_g2_i1.p1  ORF type:complete len:512 (-),score=110.33 TRINITY_DN10416_c0_g2_i1:74-1609(-)